MTNPGYDVIVVGARVAGSSTAALLARNGLRVLLVDRASFPSDAISTHQVQLLGVATLRRLGVLKTLRAAGTPATRTVRFEAAGSVLNGTFPAFEDVDALYSPRRTLLDATLVAEARAAGAEVREGFTVDEVVVEDGRAVGIRGRDGNGPAVSELATLVVGADGKHSRVARSVDAAVERSIGPRTVAAYTYWSGLPTCGGEVYQRQRRALGLWPTNDGLTLSYIAWPIDEFDTFRADIEGNVVRTIAAMGLDDRIHAARREERIRTTPDVPNIVRTSVGPGWALVGDAGLVMDPITGQGIGHALRDAESLSTAVTSGLDGTRPLDDALAAYRTTRDAAHLPMWDFTTELASFKPTAAEERVLFSALAKSSVETDRFLGVLGGAIPIADYLRPANLRKVVGLRGFAKIAIGKMHATRAA
jgi:2-polyprenyl-6-methoxyphenol hydroxylase-like FAD-dependent oxidoreductase